MIFGFHKLNKFLICVCNYLKCIISPRDRAEVFPREFVSSNKKAFLSVNRRKMEKYILFSCRAIVCVLVSKRLIRAYVKHQFGFRESVQCGWYSSW